MDQTPLKELLYKLADDQLILGHRNSEWTGMGPLLEEDIAFSSMAQDKVGQSLALYTLLHELGERDPDTVAFTRNANQFHNLSIS
ncbi:MAG: Phenylacetic acid catabolic protein [Cytophagales bacterium]|nr:Phenylacetic acid catabolic protein [Cytophagales bacterium]